jgi:hypothetical protein
MHTPYSDGEWYHAAIAEAAARAGLDMIYVTDHNVWVQGPERYHTFGDKKVLVLIGEEVHDQTRVPQKNHLLVYGAEKELARYAPKPQDLIDAARERHGLTFLAHPHDPGVPLLKWEPISWEAWEVEDFTGLEIWNYMADFGGLLTSRAAAVSYAFTPDLGMMGPQPATLARWDVLTRNGRRVVGIANADAHANEFTLGGLKRVLFPYEFLFRQVNTHIVTETTAVGDPAADKQMFLAEIANGHCFIGYDGIYATKGFRFTANTMKGAFNMGDEVINKTGLTLQISTPAKAQIRLLRDGKPLQQWENQTHVTHIVPASEGGVFRVEAHLLYKGRLRGWIYSNPIYVRADT